MTPKNLKQLVIDSQSLEFVGFTEFCYFAIEYLPIDCFGNVYVCCREGYHDLYKVASFLEDTFGLIMLKRLFHPACRVCKSACFRNENMKDIVLYNLPYWLRDALCDKKVESMRQQRTHINTIVNKLAQKQAKVLIYPAGVYANDLLIRNEEFNLKSLNIIGVADKDVEKHGNDFHGFNIFSPDKIAALHPDAVLIAASKEISDEIYQDLKFLEEKSIDLIRI